MTQSPYAPAEGVAQVAVRILIAGRNREDTLLEQELEYARNLAAEADFASTLEMERMEALSGAVEALRYGYDEQSGAVRLLEHLAIASAPPPSS
jgi:hypothetical protein